MTKRKRKRIKRSFEETTLGHSLRLNAPLEFDLIMQTNSLEPSADLIEQVSYSSINPYFKSVIFRKLLIKYRKNGCYQEKPMLPPDADTVRRYMRLRIKKLNSIQT